MIRAIVVKKAARSGGYIGGRRRLLATRSVSLLHEDHSAKPNEVRFGFGPPK